LQTQEPSAPEPAYPLRAAVLTACAATAILFLRRPIAFLHPQFYAEDGAVFFMDAERSPVSSILHPYSGYLHVGIRIVAALASPLDLRWIPAAYFSASLLAFVLLELALFSRRLGLPRPWVFGLLVAFMPHSGEVFDNLTNVQWLTGLGLLLLALTRDPRGPAARWLDLGYAAVAGLTGVFSIVFAPIFIARAALRRTPDSFRLACVVVAAGFVQDYEITNSVSPPEAAAPGALAVAANFGYRVWLGLLLPPNASGAAPVWMRFSVGLAGCVLILLLALGTRQGRGKGPALAAALFLLFAAVIYKFRGMLGSLDSVSAADRYFFIPKICVIWILALHLGADSKWRWPARLLLAAVLVNGCIGFQFERWNDYDWPYWAGRIKQGDWVEVPINPPGFKFTHVKPRPDGGPDKASP
jgi:hypothetical protein